ncbi:MAG: type II CRISPR RNA-guided endonuclease Cas9 [Candidatus Cloacimonetes bacterium]|nr:type II CRISPR RNA-guided endonuclease Cas9 [Candidatus Cloacimonadota bacterium]
MTKILSLDLGITSCGYAVMQEVEDNSYLLLDYGVVMRDNPNEGGTQKERREKKQSRELLDKKKNRVKQIQQLFELHGLAYQDTKHYDIWKLRSIDAFERKLNKDELFALFRFMAKHRGYKSLKIEDLIAEIDAKEKIGDCESTEINMPTDLEKFSETLAYLDALKCKHKDKTAAQIIWKLESQKENPTFRNHGNYRYMIRREDIKKEIEKIIEAQQALHFFHNEQHAKEFADKAIEIIVPQEAVTLNPDNINRCLIYKNTICAPLFSYSFDMFQVYKLVADLKIGGMNASIEQKELLLQHLLDDIKNFKCKNIYSVKDFKKILEIDDDSVKINNFQEFKTVKGKKESNNLIKFNFLPSLKKLHSDKKLDANMLDFLFAHEQSIEIFDAIATEIHLNVNPEKLLKNIQELFTRYEFEFSEDAVRDFTLALHKNKVSGTSSYSFKALKDLTLLMQEGKNESDAKEILGVSKSEDYSRFSRGIAYLKPQNKEGQLRYEMDENRISNHVVKSLINWALRVVIDLHAKHGTFDVVKLESTRELSQPDDVKRDIKAANDKNEKEWLGLIEKYQKHFEAKGLNLQNNKEYLLKLKLWEQQKGFGIYSHKVLSIDEVLSDKTEIEHVVPRACGGSNAEYNKALDIKDENAQKGNKLPLDYLNGEKREVYINFVKELKESHAINFKKFKNFMAEELKDAFKEARDDVSLHATSYTETLLGEILKRYYPFSDALKENQRVMHISGRATSYLRRILGIDNKSRDTNFHHAEDAILLGVMSRSYLQNISTNFEKNYELTLQNAKENFKKIVPTIEGASPHQIFAHIRESYMEDIENTPFYKALDGTLKTPAFWVSKKPIGTKAHNETIQSKKNMAYYVPVSSLLDKVKPSHKMGADEFYKKFNQEVYEKIQVVQDNPKDFTSQAFARKRDEVVALLNKSAFVSTKDEKTELDKELRDLMAKPLYDVNGNEIRRVRRVGEKVSIPVRKGYAGNAPSMLAMRCSVETQTRLFTDRIDFKDSILLKKNDGSYIDIFNNDLVKIFTYEKKQVVLKLTGLLRTFVINAKEDKMLKVKNPKYPIREEAQPKQYNSYVAVKKMCGIKKYKTDASGKILGFYYLGTILDDEKELFAKVLSYKAL